MNKKGARILNQVLESAKVNGVKKGLAEERLFVKEIVLGKSLGPRKIDIRARGKFGIMRPVRSSVTVILEEKSAADFYKMLMKGECPPTVGQIAKKLLY